MFFISMFLQKTTSKTAFTDVFFHYTPAEVFSLEVKLYRYKLTIRICMKCCCCVRAGAPNCNSDMLDKFQKWTCRVASPSLVVFGEPLTH